MSTTSVDIGRVVLSDLEVSPERAESLRERVQARLQRLIEQEGWAASPGESEVLYLSAPSIDPAEIQSDEGLSSALARLILEGLRSTG